MTEYKDLVWSKTGYVLKKDELFTDDQDEVFMEEDGLLKIDKATVWFCSRRDDAFFYDEADALDEELTYSQGELDDEPGVWEMLLARAKELGLDSWKEYYDEVKKE